MTSRQATWLARKRREWKEAGRCRECGAETDGHYRCARHRAKRREKKRQQKGE